MNTEQKLQKEIDRLTKALNQAQSLNADLEKDKDRAWMMLQLVLNQRLPRQVVIPQEALVSYDPRKWEVEQRTERVRGGLVLTLREK